MDDLEPINDSVECAECMCVSTAEQVKAGDMQHWNSCSSLSEKEPLELDEFERQQDR